MRIVRGHVGLNLDIFFVLLSNVFRFDFLRFGTRAGYDYWTGGLNPGLLWIWANSARPVVPKDSTRPEDQIAGSGRCLRLTPNAAAKVYAYSGAECSNRHRYVCKHEENATDKALSRIHKALKDGSRRQTVPAGLHRS